MLTFELKNSLTKQTVDDAVEQYKRDRNPREKLFEFGRCVAHFAVDEHEARFSAHLQGKASWFLPFNRGWSDGAGNPPNPEGIKTDYLWRQVLARKSLTNILENYAQVIESKDDKTGRRKKTQIWPRYHQLVVVRHLLADAGTWGAGQRYLIQHSAGSGKSNSIAWLAHQLVGLEHRESAAFDSIIVVTDRRILDRQIRDTIRQYAQVGATVGHAEHSGDLRRFIEEGKKIIVSTVQKFPFILDEIGNEQRGRRFAIIIDEARAMVVTNGIERAIQYFHAIRDYLKTRKSPFKAIVAFSGEHEFGGAPETEASLNGFPSGKIAERFREHPYRFLVCADKFQTGYDEPLLHTMYVDKTLAGIKAVQTLSRLNRARPDKHDAFVLDFLNDIDTIQGSFEPFHRGTVLADETDPNKLHDLQAELDGAQIYSRDQVESLVSQYLEGADRERLDPILDTCVAAYMADLDEDGQIAFKGNAKAFVRTYAFLGCVLPYNNTEWEKRSIFLNFLIPRLPSPAEDDLSRGILEAIDMDSYRVEKRATQRILLADDEGEVGPVPTSAGGGLPEPELDPLSLILREFNDRFGDVEWEDADRVRDLIAETIRSRVADDEAYRNARENSDKENARVEHDRALRRVMTSLMKDDTQLFKLFMDDEGFKHWLTERMFHLTYHEARSA